ncbi:sugar ABC transporter permease [Mycoplasmopsis edwardii]|nr:sugar ABC transporter permease [Mycoplasmopsis edwardii]
MNKLKNINGILKRYWKALSLILPLIILLIIFYIVPIITTLKESFIVFPSQNKKTFYIYDINNYKNVINDYDFKVAISNSTFLFFIPPLISLLMAIFLSYWLSALTLKRTKSFFLKMIYSQFFISSFVVGIAFILLFGEQNLFFKLFNSNKSFLYGQNKLNIKLYLFIFQMWRSLPFNIVILSFVFMSVNNKYKKIMQIDNLNIADKLKLLYFKEFKKHLFLLVYTNIIFSFLMYPGAIINESDVSMLKAHTLTSYILSLIKPIDNTISVDNNKAYAASFIALLYLICLFLCSLIIIKVTQITFIKIRKRMLNV